MVRQEVRRWLARATAIPDAPIRRDALNALERKRGHTDGAALFAILPRARSIELLRVLVAYEIMCDFLDSASERGAKERMSDGMQLHLALVDAFDLDRLPSDYYLLHPWGNDGGYLRSLVSACRHGCAQLPSYGHVRPLVVGDALRADVLAINHEPDSIRRDAGLRAWAARERGDVRDMAWFELTGAASATLTTHALLALAASPYCRDDDAAMAHKAYLWINLATTMLDSYVDQLEDRLSGDHSYVAHYPTECARVARIQSVIERSLFEARRLPCGERHAVIVACMVAMYLAKDSARSSELRDSSTSLIYAGGSLTRLLLPILRMWRIVYSQRSC